MYFCVCYLYSCLHWVGISIIQAFIFGVWMKLLETYGFVIYWYAKSGVKGSCLNIRADLLLYHHKWGEHTCVGGIFIGVCLYQGSLLLAYWFIYHGKENKRPACLTIVCKHSIPPRDVFLSALLVFKYQIMGLRFIQMWAGILNCYILSLGIICGHLQEGYLV
jgi:hypothetical protein